jgi:hypothetical protein
MEELSVVQCELLKKPDTIVVYFDPKPMFDALTVAYINNIDNLDDVYSRFDPRPQDPENYYYLYSWKDLSNLEESSRNLLGSAKTCFGHDCYFNQPLNIVNLKI